MGLFLAARVDAGTIVPAAIQSFGDDNGWHGGHHDRRRTLAHPAAAANACPGAFANLTGQLVRERHGPRRRSCRIRSLRRIAITVTWDATPQVRKLRIVTDTP
jgi:hypothetical protein